MVISDDGKQLNDIGLEGEPWGIVVVPDKVDNSYQTDSFLC
jgi:hypothetical protein